MPCSDIHRREAADYLTCMIHLINLLAKYIKALSSSMSIASRKPYPHQRERKASPYNSVLEQKMTLELGVSFSSSQSDRIDTLCNTGHTGRHNHQCSHSCKPSPTEIASLLARAKSLPHNYAPPLYTQFGSKQLQVPRGYLVDRHRTQIGQGAAAFVAAKAAMQQWRHFDLGSGSASPIPKRKSNPVRSSP